MNIIESESGSRQSLRFRYFRFAAIITIALVLGSSAASIYVKDVSRKNSAALLLHDTVTKIINDIRYSIQLVNDSLNSMLISPQQKHQETIKYHLDRTKEKLDSLNELASIESAGLKNIIHDLNENINILGSSIYQLLALVKDPDWVYPMLPFINNTLLESNIEFESAISLALQEIASDDGDEYISTLYRDFAKIRDLWRLQILNFRAIIVRFSGLNRVERTAQEQNIVVIHEEIEKNLLQISSLGNAGKLGLETEEALQIMKFRSKKWFTDYQEAIKLRSAKIWRADIDYIEKNIRPLQAHVTEDLINLENTVLSWSSRNVTALEYAANQILVELWILTGAALVYVALVYIMISRAVLTPIERIANTISEDSEHTDILDIPIKGSKEIHKFISAFNYMRNQIRRRQIALEHQALHDALTGLPNRALLNDRLNQAIVHARRHSTSVAFILLDLDRFKEINDTLGHTVGDRLLQEIATRIHNCLRTSDTVARFGGDEFALVCSDTDSEQTAIFVEKIIHHIRDVITIDKQNLYVGASAGISLYPDNGDNAADLIRLADLAMYDAKNHNRNFSFFREELDNLNTEDLSLLGHLREELKENTGQMSIYYQPIIDLNKNQITSAEALLRWNHPNRDFIPPEKIIRMAEQSGLISELTAWVLDQGIKNCKNWEQNGLSLNVSINLSAWNLQDPELPSIIQKLLSKHQLDPMKVTLELTESTIMSDPIHARNVLEQLSRMNVDIDIDDYGTGFSSLAYLKILPVDKLKIDKSFVIDMQTDEDDKIIVQSTIDLAHNLKLLVIAEGVENKESFLYLKQHHCDFAQGNFIAHPMPEPEFRKWCESYNPEYSQ